jgi:hypothetical protein
MAPVTSQPTAHGVGGASVAREDTALGVTRDGHRSLDVRVEQPRAGRRSWGWAVALTALAACGGGGVGVGRADPPEERDELQAAGAVAAVAKVTPDSPGVGEEVSLSVTMTTTRATYLDVDVTIRGPGGQTVYALATKAQPVRPDSPLELEHLLTVEATDPAGTYVVGVVVQHSGTGKVLLEKGSAAQYTMGGATSCTPQCGGKQCGSDGCEGSCGTCSSGTCTSAGVCEKPTTSPPANPNLLPSARNLLAYLQSMEGKGILAGQHERDDCTTCESDRMKGLSGRWPAIHGHEVADYATDPFPEAINDWSVRRQLVTFSWHMSAPPNDDSNWENVQVDADVDRVLQSGTNENRVYLAKLDKMAKRLQALEDAKVPVLWRPFHEMNGGWFWWSKSGAGAYKRLWVQMFNYFTTTKGLDNLIWVWSAAENELPNADWFPGSQYVDIVGSDTYSSRSNLENWASHYAAHKVIAPNKLVALTECDHIPDPAELQLRELNLIWFLPWYGQWVDLNSKRFISEVYNHAYVITADEMPDLR